MKKIIDLIIWFVWFPLRDFLLLTPHRVKHFILGFCAALFYLADSRRRNGVKEEVQLLYGSRFNKKEINRIARSSFDHFFNRLFENLYYGRIDAEYFNRIASIEGLDHLKTALQKNKGALLIQFHFGSFLLILLALAFQGIRVNAFAGAPLKGEGYIKKKLVELRNHERETYPFGVLTIRSSLLPVVKALKKNEVIGVTIDGRQGTNFIPIRLFERTALFSTGLIDLSIRTGAPILPLAVVRGKDKKQRVIIEPEMELIKSDDREEMLRLNLEKYIRNYEKYLLNHPDHMAMTLYSMREEVRKGINSPLFID
ncbi:MAG: hypothetical protein CO150_09820 [Nitrospirae bacterium CG_4_9_14_3_um_filter_53_35]|nr:MAG: hypothetical protein COT35_10595 [Nitrospirae bacterium CG08_land_8_20_14_0_20_52_24]PIV83081.1 MAG: hypothetical protein COW52_10095 [Nitrospirae bacterium CG17_big_fil_post_rev_8_21_14_2_50_50_9]PIW85889.1 MAG: hypothetical protein COZ95_02220 [Nitrospirae bacterium CG_4_8_14_3_um_filter_50_41]PIX86643.1 MAG: hypothetical protein COZ32_02255 [Nitrospirae bacterium CG_4_10_14_3_um_filter_53_41]PJA72855.1 MAG: hypothetical protein CO150_09820 [Nitrospirae bacterium CG_4_9_14_3_um_filter